MTAPPPEPHLEAWRRLVDRYRAFIEARMEVVRLDSVVELVRAGIHKPEERTAALSLVPFLPEEARKSLFPVLLSLASYAHGQTDEAIAQILSLPRDWVLATIRQHAEPILQNGTYEEYRMMLRIYDELGADAMAQELAERAAKSDDADIREAGEDFLAAD